MQWNNGPQTVYVQYKYGDGKTIVLSDEITLVGIRAYLSRPWLYPAAPRRYRPFYVFGYLKPGHAGYTRLYIYRKVGGRWRYAGRRAARNRGYRGYTRYWARLWLSRPGYYYVRAYHWDAGHGRTLSPVRIFRVR